MIVVYKIIKGDGTLGNLGEKRVEGIYESNDMNEITEKLRSTFGTELKRENKSSSNSGHMNVLMDYKKFILLAVYVS